MTISLRKRVISNGIVKWVGEPYKPPTPVRAPKPISKPKVKGAKRRTRKDVEELMKEALQIFFEDNKEYVNSAEIQILTGIGAGTVDRWLAKKDAIKFTTQKLIVKRYARFYNLHEMKDAGIF